MVKFGICEIVKFDVKCKNLYNGFMKICENGEICLNIWNKRNVIEKVKWYLVQNVEIWQNTLCENVEIIKK